MHNILCTNEQLHSFNPQKFPSPLCTFCKQAVETHEHLFFQCNFSEALWKDLCVLLKEPLKLQHYPSKLCKILSDPRESIIVNFICLLVRRHIYYSKMLEKRPCLDSFLPFMKRIYQCEYWIAVQNKKLAIHVKKWSGLCDLFKTL